MALCQLYLGIWAGRSHDIASMVLDAIGQAIWTRQQRRTRPERYHHTDGMPAVHIDRWQQKRQHQQVGRRRWKLYDECTSRERSTRTRPFDASKPGGPSRMSSWPPRPRSTGSAYRLYQYCGDVAVELEGFTLRSTPETSRRRVSDQRVGLAGRFQTDGLRFTMRTYQWMLI